jgi:hypothetical protein
MTVKELIKQLGKMPETAEVVIVHQDWSVKKVQMEEEKNIVELA